MKSVIYILCTLAILVQLPTAADMFLGTYNMVMFGPSVRNFQALGYATVFEVSILIFVIQRRLWYASIFAFFSLLTNLISHNVWDWLTQSSPWLISIQLPLAIGIYSHELERLRRARLQREAEEEMKRNLPPEPDPINTRRPRKSQPAPPFVMEYENAQRKITLHPEELPGPYNNPAGFSSVNGNGHGKASILPEANTLKALVAEADLMEPNCTCEQCQKQFYSKVPGTRFCNPKCRSKWHRNKTKDDEEGNKEGFNPSDN